MNNNIYDTEKFFDEYAKMSRSREGLREPESGISFGGCFRI